MRRRHILVGIAGISLVLAAAPLRAHHAFSSEFDADKPLKLEGTISNIPPQGGRKHPEQQYIQMDTTQILFICGGTFVGLEDIIRKRLGRRQIGFGS